MIECPVEKWICSPSMSVFIIHPWFKIMVLPNSVINVGVFVLKLLVWLYFLAVFILHTTICVITKQHNIKIKRIQRRAAHQHISSRVIGDEMVVAAEVVVATVWDTWSLTPVKRFFPCLAITHQYMSSSLSVREVMVTVKTLAVLSSAMKLLSLYRFLGVFTTMVHSSYIFPLHQYLVCSLNCWSYWHETVTDPPRAAVTTAGADSWAESTACFVSQRRHRTGV